MQSPHSSVLAAFLAHAAAEPTRPCLIWQNATLSYGQLADAAAAWATQYVALRVERGERVGLYLGSGPSFVAAYLGAQLAGAATVLLNTQYRQNELRHILSDSQPRVVVTEPELVGYLDESAKAQAILGEGQAPVLQVVDGSLFGLPVPADGARLTDFVLPQGGELAVLAYTSGTTGRSKGAMLTHGCLAANMAALTAAWEWSAADRLLLVLPLFHIHGLGVGVHGTLWSGASLELWPRFEPAAALTRLAAGGISMFFGVPTLYGRLLQQGAAQPAAAQAAGQQLRLFVSGSAPLSAQTFAEFATMFGQPILERYGMTETGMNTTNPYRGERRPGSVGMPFPGQQARVVDLHSRAVLPAGEEGEIEVRGPHLFAGYWRNPVASAAELAPDGWFRTGDLGHRDDTGRYAISGRAKELIISGGYNIYPREVEEALLAHPAVAECAVVGLPDTDFGEQVVAAVVLEPGNPEQGTGDSPSPMQGNSEQLTAELIGFCRERLAAYKRPRAIYYVDSLPRNALGKLVKSEVRAMLATSDQRGV